MTLCMGGGGAQFGVIPGQVARRANLPAAGAPRPEHKKRSYLVGRQRRAVTTERCPRHGDAKDAAISAKRREQKGGESGALPGRTPTGGRNG